MFTTKITPNNENQRIDNFINAKFYKIPKSLLYKMIRIGNIKINHKKILPSYKLQIGDLLNISNMYLQEKQNKKIFLNSTFKQQLLSSILYEDKYLLIINKPSGIAVHGGSGLKFGIIESFRIIKPQYKYLELVHRLDRNTSGVLIIAKKKFSLKNMHEQFRNQKIKKTYIAVTHGTFLKNKTIISAPLIKMKSHDGKNIIKISKTGKKSISTFYLKKKINSINIVYIIPKTGRTHQIRVHAAHIGCPILFDHDYGDKKLDYTINKQYNNTKILLHAKKIIFHHPHTNNTIMIDAPLEKRFKKYINTTTLKL